MLVFNQPAKPTAISQWVKTKSTVLVTVTATVGEEVMSSA